MRSIVGTWTLISETAADSASEPGALLYGGAPVGRATFTAEGRVVAVLTDGPLAAANFVNFAAATGPLLSQYEKS